MLRVSNIKISIDDDKSKILKLVLNKLKIKEKDLIKYHIFKESIDARKKGKIDFVYTVDVELKNEQSIIKKGLKDVVEVKQPNYIGVQHGSEKLQHRPVVVGSGPAGLFAALLLAQRGYNPLLLERGLDVDERTKDIKNFWNNRIFKNNSNVQFGEGGAGTFSDGKLTTRIKDIRCRKVLEELVNFGSPDEILYSHKPHVGTDILKNVVKNIREEIRVIRERDPAIHSDMEVFLYPSFKVMLHYRLAHKLYLKKHYFLARWVSQRGVRKTGIEIHPGAQIGKGLFIDHGNGVIIGETAILGDNVTLYQGVTLGGTGKEQGKRHPTVGNNVMISAGAKVLGSFTIGDNSKIGAGSVVLEEVPPGCTVVGVPGHVVKRDKQSLPQEDLDQVTLPDPVQEDITELKKTNAVLINRILELEENIKEIKRNMNSEKEI